MTKCPNCNYGRLELREWGTYTDHTPISEHGRVMTEHRKEDNAPERTGYDVWCPVCKTVAPATLTYNGFVQLTREVA